jgi:hypothetical protein
MGSVPMDHFFKYTKLSTCIFLCFFHVISYYVLHIFRNMINKEVQFCNLMLKQVDFFVLALCLLFLRTVYRLSCELEGSIRILCNLSALKFTFNICFRRRTLVAIGTHDLDTLHCPLTYEVGFVSSHSSYHIVLYIFSWGFGSCGIGLRKKLY